MSLCIITISERLTQTTFIITFALVAAALMSDVLDGHLARRWNVVTPSGYVLDAMGDRSLHLALTLVMLGRYGFSPVVAWLLIFRDIGIYGVRILSQKWLEQSKTDRWISVTHATAVRVWLVSFIVRDGVRVFAGTDRFSSPLFSAASYTLIWGTIAFSYWGLGRSVNRIMTCEHEHI